MLCLNYRALIFFGRARERLSGGIRRIFLYSPIAPADTTQLPLPGESPGSHRRKMHTHYDKINNQIVLLEIIKNRQCNSSGGQMRPYESTQEQYSTQEYSLDSGHPSCRTEDINNRNLTVRTPHVRRVKITGDWAG